ncbi:MAG: PAS domain S-box protein [Anaerolineae bacterium]
MQEAIALMSRRLEEAEMRYAALLENLEELAFTIAADDSVTHLAGNCVGITGYTDQELLLLTNDQLLRMLLPTGYDTLREAIKVTRASDASHTLAPLPLIDKAGEVRAVQITLSPLTDQGSAAGTLHGIARDVSNQVRAQRTMASLNAAAEAVQHEAVRPERVLQVVTEQLASLGLASIILLLDKDTGRLAPADRSCPPRMEEYLKSILGPFTEMPAIGITDVPIVQQTMHTREASHFRWTGQLLAQIWRSRSPDVLARLVQMTAVHDAVAAPLVADSSVLGVLMVTGEHLTPESVPAMAAFANQTAIAFRNANLVKRQSESEAKYRSIFETSIDGMFVIEPTGLVVSANPTACALFGYALDELVGSDWRELAGQTGLEDFERLLRKVHRVGRYHAESLAKRRDGATFSIEVIGAPMPYRGKTHLLAIVRDITDRVSAQDALIRAERLEALGQMAGGIAHDFNNILVSVRGYSDLALQDLVDAPNRVSEDVQHVLTAANQAAETVRRLQALSRHQEDTSDFSTLQVDDMVREAVELSQPRWKDQAQGSGITVRVHLNLASSAAVLGNACELRRVFTNLIANALDAMPSGGDLCIDTYRQGDWALTSVSDSGCGIPPELHTRIFEPFYSTKAGTGTGLGLTIAQSTVRRHGGEITVASRAGQGATFRVRMPAVKTVITVPKTPEYSTAPAVQATGQRILVVDDESAVRGLLQRVLTRQGHQVTACDGGAAALAALEESVFDVLITDLGMPEVSGHQVARRARELYPQMPIVLSTGWGDSISPDQVRSLGANALLSKPFTLNELASVLEQVSPAGA